MTCNIRKKTRAFTLLETMVAIAVLLTAIVGPMSIMGDAITQMYAARDQVLAISLAQEGIEAVRQKRDSNMLSRWDELGRQPQSALHWYDDLTEGTYKLEFDGDGKAALSFGSGPVYKNRYSGLYTQSEVNGDPTKFTRTITILDIEGPSDEKEVNSTITWPVGDTNRVVTVKEHIFGINQP